MIGLVGPIRGGQIPLRSSLNKPRVLVLIDQGHLNSPGRAGLMAGMIDAYATGLRDRGIGVSYVLTPSVRWKTPKSREGYLRSETLVLQTVARLILREAGGILRFRRPAIGSEDASRAFSERLLDATSAQLVMGIGLFPALMRVLNQRGLIGIEFQHGILGEETIARYWPTSMQASGGAPSAIVTWDELYSTNARSHGFAALSVQKQRWVDVPLRDPVGETVSHDRVNNTLLVPCQWGYGVETGTAFGVLKRDVFELVVAFSHEFGSSNVVVRLHPHTVAQPHYAEVVSWFEEQMPGVHVSNPHTRSLVDDLRSSRMLVCGPSATVFEAACLGVRSVVLGTFASDELPDELVRTGLVAIQPHLDQSELRRLWLLPDPKPYQPVTRCDERHFLEGMSALVMSRPTTADLDWFNGDWIEPSNAPHSVKDM